MTAHRARIRITVALVALLTAASVIGSSGAAAATGTIAGVAFQDGNRNGALDADETPMPDQQLYLFDGAGQTYLGTTVTDGTGRYAFSGLADGSYRVDYAASAWQPLKTSWVPTTTGSVLPQHAVQLVGAATANFGWRPIVRSTTAGLPITSYTGPSGVRVESYTDAVSAQAVHGALDDALLGQEATSVLVRFDLGSDNSTSTGVQQSNGQYSSYNAVSYVTYGSWLDGGDQTLVHEYGHAWSLYFGLMVQQDSTLASYVRARGLAGDARLDTSYTWSVREMIAEDYRQLFGSPNAAARAQANTEIPAASAVAGLRTFLQDSFRTAPVAGSTSTTSAASAPTVTGLTVSPQPVAKTATISFTLSSAAAVTVKVIDSSGAVVRTLLSDMAKASGQVGVTWDRKNSAGRRVAAGSYRVVVDATASGATTSASTAVAVG